MQSHAELAARLVELLEGYGQQSRVMGVLAECMAAAIGELDPDHELDGTDWAALPRWARLDGTGRLCRAWAELQRVETRTGETAGELRSWVNTQTPGFSLFRAHVTLMGYAFERAGLLSELSNAERAVHKRLRPETSARLRAAISAARRHQITVGNLHARLAPLLASKAG